MTTCSECAVRVYASGERKKYVCGCGAIVCGKHALFYFDDSNRAITSSARPHCPTCWAGRDMEQGVIGHRNLLASGDYPHRLTARARFRVELTAAGSRLVTAWT